MSSVPSSIHATAAKVHFLPRIFVLPINDLLDATAWHASGIPEVDPDLSTIPLVAYCFMTGWMSVSPSATIPLPSLTLYHLIVM
jgi:hypothetical protein